MKHYFSTRVRAVLIASVLLVVVMAILGSMIKTDVGSNVVQGILSPLRAGVSKLTDGAEQLYSYMFRYEAVAAENEALKQQIAKMENDARRADSVTRENERLRALLQLKEANEDYVLLDAYVIGRSSVDWKNNITINKGTNASIEKDMCAITANGELVGLVSEVGPNYAVIKTVLDPSLEIRATISSSGDSGMVKGGYSVNAATKLRMSHLAVSAFPHNYDQVVSTGSTYYPRNLILGYVIDAGHEETGVAKYAILEPAVNIGVLEQVFVILDYEAE